MSFLRYPKYKDSGVDWLGEVPEHWEVASLKRLVEFQNGADYKEVEAEEGYPVYGSGGIFAYASDYLYDGESVLLGRKGTVDKPAYVTGRFWTVDTMYWTRIKQGAYGKFCYYVATSIPFAYYSTSTALPSMTQSALGAHLITFPQLLEQQKIAAFLDSETEKIDALVVEQEKLIALLKEKRQAVISHAVTKGLNPNAKMKDSGIEWLGEVPEHWEVKRLRFVAELNPSKSEISQIDRELEVSFLPMETIGDDGSLHLDRIRPISEVENGYTYFREGDVTIAKITPCFENGKGAVMRGLLEGIGFGTTELVVARPMGFKSNSEFLHWLFVSTPFRKLGEASMYGAGGQKRMPDDFVRNFTSAFPPIKEQQDIADFLDMETTKFDALISEAVHAIELLKERRSALISAAVTGKIDVRNLSTAKEAA